MYHLYQRYLDVRLVVYVQHELRIVFQLANLGLFVVTTTRVGRQTGTNMVGTMARRYYYYILIQSTIGGGWVGGGSNDYLCIFLLNCCREPLNSIQGTAHFLLRRRKAGGSVELLTHLPAARLFQTAPPTEWKGINNTIKI